MSCGQFISNFWKSVLGDNWIIAYEVSNSAFKSTCSFENLREYLTQEVQIWTDMIAPVKNPNVLSFCVLWEVFPRGKLALEKWGLLL